MASSVLCVTKEQYIKGRTVYLNDNNLTKHAPFTFKDGTLIVEPECYDGWAKSDVLQMLRAKMMVARAEGPVERLSCDFECAPEWFFTVYQTLNARSNARRWWSELLYSGGVIPLTDGQSQLLFSGDAESRRWLKEQIQAVMDVADPKPLAGWFIKCGTCSTKHQYPPEPVFNGAEAVCHVLDALPIQRALKRNTAECFVLRPWDSSITDTTEVRVFARDGIVTGVSQQACYSRVARVLSLWDPSQVISAAQNCYDSAMSKLPPTHRYPYQCTYDAHIQSTRDGDPVVHLIEINSGEFGWGPAGASLFSWQYDPPPLTSEPRVVYVVA